MGGLGDPGDQNFNPAEAMSDSFELLPASQDTDNSISAAREKHPNFSHNVTYRQNMAIAYNNAIGNSENYKHPSAQHRKLDESLLLGIGEQCDVAGFDSLDSYFDNWVRYHPLDTAIIAEDGRAISYLDASMRVATIMALFSELGVKEGDCIVLYCAPSADVWCSLVATYKLGCIFVPVDTLNPVARLQLITDDCKPKIIVHQGKEQVLSQTPRYNLSTLLDLSIIETPNVAEDPNRSRVTGFRDACIQYTSGTTGTPKGVILTHSGLKHFVGAFQRRYTFGKETVLQHTSLGFDMSLTQVYHAFTTGGTIVVANEETRSYPGRLAQLVFDKEVTLGFFTPTQAAALLLYGSETLQKCHTLTRVFLAGEVFPVSLAVDFRVLGLRNLHVYNHCGPTEITIAYSSGEDVLNDANVVIENPTLGKSLANYSTYILDSELKPVPLGAAGEICVAGPGVSPGYLGRPEQTSAKFISNPFACRRDIEIGCTAMYRTGDKGKFLHDGQIVYLGRIDGDSQIKLRGVRVELDDIASTIVRENTQIGLIREAAVSLRHQNDGSNDFLVAFVTLSLKRRRESGILDLLEDLRTNLPLPRYMIPSVIFPIDKLPQTVNGKLDREALNTIPLQTAANKGTANNINPNNKLEQKLKDLWLDTLPMINAANISDSSDFFLCGGNSITLLKLYQGLLGVFGPIIQVADLFQNRTFGAMKKAVSEGKHAES